MSGKSTILIAVVLGLLAGFLGGSLSTPQDAPTGGKELAELQRRIAALEAEIDGEKALESGQAPGDDGREKLSLRIAALEAKLSALPGADVDAEARQAERRRLEGLTTSRS